MLYRTHLEPFGDVKVIGFYIYAYHSFPPHADLLGTLVYADMACWQQHVTLHGSPPDSLCLPPQNCARSPHEEELIGPILSRFSHPSNSNHCATHTMMTRWFTIAQSWEWKKKNALLHTKARAHCNRQIRLTTLTTQSSPAPASVEMPYCLVLTSNSSRWLLDLVTHENYFLLSFVYATSAHACRGVSHNIHVNKRYTDMNDTLIEIWGSIANPHQNIIIVASSIDGASLGVALSHFTITHSHHLFEHWLPCHKPCGTLIANS